MDVNKIKVLLSGTDETSGAFASVNKNLKQIENQATQSSNLIVSALGKIGPALAAGFSARELLAASDSLTRIQGRLKNVTDSQTSYNQSLQDVQRIAAAAQAPIDSIAALYARSYRAMESMGASQTQIALLSENVALALKAEGAAASESSSTLIQLSQALASGVLRGDEFNSIAENAPLIQKALADSLGVTIGELRAMAKEGEITSKVMLDALGSEKLNATFRAQAANMQTASGAQAELSNNFSIFTGLLAKNSGIVELYVAALGSISRALKEINELLSGGNISLDSYLPGYKKFREMIDGEPTPVWAPTKKAGTTITKDEFEKLSLGGYSNSTVRLANQTNSAEFQKEIDQLSQIVALTKEGMSVENARITVKYQDKGATDAQIKSYIALNEAIGKSSKAKNTDAIAKEIQQMGQVNALIQQGVSVEDARTIARLKAQGATESTIKSYLAYQQAITQATESEKALADAKKEAQQISDQAIAANQQVIASVYDSVVAAQEEMENYGKLPSEITKATIARLEEVKAIAYSIGLGDENVANINREIEARKQLLEYQEGTEGKKAADEAKKKLQEQGKEAERVAKKAADEAQRQFERTSDIMSRSLTDALMRGFENGKSFAENFKDSLINMFKTLILEPGIRFVLNASGVTGLASGLGSLFPQTANAGGVAATGGNIFEQGLSVIKGINQGFDLLNGGFQRSVEGLGVFLSDSNTAMFKDLGGLIGQYSSEITNVLGYGGAALAGINYLKNGNYLGAALTAGGSLFGVGGAAIGSVLGGLVGGLFGGKSPPMVGSQATGTYAGGQYSGSYGQYGRKDIGAGASLNQISEAFATSLGQLLGAYGLNDTVGTSALYRQRTNIKGYFGASFAGGSFYDYLGKGIDFQSYASTILGSELVKAIKMSSLPTEIRNLFNGITDKTAVQTMIAATISLTDNQAALASKYDLTATTAAAVASATGLAGDNLAQFIGTLTQTTFSSQKVSEQMIQQRDKLADALGAAGGNGSLTGDLKAFDDFLKSLDKTTAGGQKEFADLFSLRDQVGSVDQAWSQLMGSVNSSIYGLLSPAEQAAKDSQALSDMFAELGLQVPATTADLIALGQSIQQNFNSADEASIDLALAFPTLVNAFTSAKDKIIDSAREMNQFTNLADYRFYKGVANNYGSAYANSYDQIKSYISSNAAGDSTVNGQAVTDMVQLLKDMRDENKRAAISQKNTADTLEQILRQGLKVNG